MESIKLLANLEFAKLLTEATADITTASGQGLMKKYQSYLLTNECTFGLVNSFLREAKNCMFENAVASVSKTISEYINANQYSWQLASACESIHNSNSRFNYLNENACKQVESLLEGKSEEDVVKYIKAGALKNVMFVESFRNITKSIFKDVPVMEMKKDYTAVTPISITESNNGKTYFEVCGNIYSINAERLVEKASAKDVSNDFLTIARLMESNELAFENDMFKATVGNFEYIVEGCDKLTKKKKNVEEEEKMTTAQLREHTEMYMMAIGQHNYAVANMLESIAKLSENYDNILTLDEVKFIVTESDKFIVIESGDKLYAELIASNHASKWSVYENAIETLKFIKDKTSVDLSEHYQSQIEKVVESTTAEEKQKVLESIHNDEMRARRERIEKLTEQFKNDPIKLQMLAKLAQDLNELN